MPDGVFKYDKKGTTTWGVRLKFKVLHEDHTITWKAKTWRGFGSQKEARAFRDDARDQRELKKYPTRPTESPALVDYLQDWLDTYAIPNCKRSTALSYTWVINKYWVPAMGTVPITLITVDHIKDLLNDLIKAGKSKQTIRNVFGPVREALSHAVGEGAMLSNPVLAIKPHLRQIRDPKRHVNPLTIAQSAILLNAAKTLDPTMHRAILLCRYAGLRPGELLGLQWGDIDPINKHATIRRAWVWEHLTTPKNHQLRVVDFPPILMKHLQPEKHPPKEHVLTRQGAPIKRSWCSTTFAQVVKHAGLPPMRFYDLRHTYASHLIAIGANPKYIQTQMGHSTISVTFDVYGHLFKTERFADKLT